MFFFPYAENYNAPFSGVDFINEGSIIEAMGKE
jgi:hypothetical protein